MMLLLWKRVRAALVVSKQTSTTCGFERTRLINPVIRLTIANVTSPVLEMPQSGAVAAATIWIFTIYPRHVVHILHAKTNTKVTKWTLDKDNQLKRSCIRFKSNVSSDKSVWFHMNWMHEFCKLVYENGVLSFQFLISKKCNDNKKKYKTNLLFLTFVWILNKKRLWAVGCLQK